jgi:plastocyanin
MRRPFLLGILATLLLEAAVVLLVVWSGVVDVSATREPGVADRVLGYASARSIARHARDEKNPLASDPAALKRGLQHYQAMCVTCHGGPGAEPQEFAAGLHPPAPDLASPEVQAFTDGMLYETVARGIGSTGMPAFGASHPPEDLWSIVAFVRHLPALTPEEKEALGGAEGGHEHDAREGNAQPDAPADAGQRVHHVSISGFKFTPAALEVHVGDAVEWKNEDFAAHTATADDRSFDTGKLEAGATKRVVVQKKGRFPYFCKYHLAMKGQLVVE